MPGTSSTARVIRQAQAEGRQQLAKELFDFMEKKYLDPKIVTNSPEAKAILAFVREVSAIVNKEVDRT